MPQMTTVHATTEFRQAAWGGIASALELMVAAAGRARHRTLVLAVGPRDEVRPILPDVRVCTVGMPELMGRSLYRSARRVALGRLAARRMAAVLPRLIGDGGADLLVHSEELGTLLTAPVPVRRRIFVSHGLAVQEHPHRPDLLDQERRTLALADTVVVLSAAQADVLRRGYPGLSRVRVLPLPLALLAQQLSPVAAGGAADGCVVAAGRAVRQKGFDILLRAVCEARVSGRTADGHRFPPVVVYAGHGDDDYLEECRRIAARCGSAAILRPWLPREQLIEVLRRARLVCVPSRFEPVGLIAAEALALGVPVVASRVGGLPDVLGRPAAAGWTVPVTGDDGPAPADLAACLTTATRSATGPTRGPEQLRPWSVDRHLAALIRILDR
ncbi:glycosyltransferase family 4 protein [Streptomyces sp. NPDC003717]|uniref:glycosyltransferase family 4 protein n=1 Tax=Streptomyces sp. NPDC003717 TaxID=3154276 RepID=UPI0033A7ED8B